MKSLVKNKGTGKMKKEEEKTEMKGKEDDETELNEKMEGGEYKCYKCGVIMRIMKKFTCHIRQKHVEIQRNGLRFKCDVCKKPMTSMKELMCHMMKEHIRFKCDECGTIRESMKELNEHKWAKHEDRRVANDKAQKENERHQDTKKYYVKSMKKNMGNIKRNKKKKEYPEKSSRGENGTKEYEDRQGNRMEKAQTNEAKSNKEKERLG